MGKFNFKTSSNWYGVSHLSSKSFICWNCNNQIASSSGLKKYNSSENSKVYICPNCDSPNLIDSDNLFVMKPLSGIEIKRLPRNIENIYTEIRVCMQNSCFTSVVMLSRKLIQNIAVHEGAEENKRFIEYIDYLYDENIIPKKSKSKADSIRTLGNSANHEIENRSEEDANHCLSFIELLLKVNYEFADEEEVKK